MKSIIELENGYVWYSEIAVGERRDPFGGGDEKSGESVECLTVGSKFLFKEEIGWELWRLWPPPPLP